MVQGVADTHAVIWYLSASPRLSLPAKAYLDTATATGDQIAISSITLIEMIYLIEKGRIAAESFTHLVSLPEGARGLFLEVPRDMRISRSLARVGANTVPDMPDRIIAATALYLGVPVISKDSKIHLSGLTTIW